MKLVFDIGMYDASDTSYYLSEGNKVIAVEAIPELINQAKEQFKEEIASGQLVLVNAAVCESPREQVTFHIAAADIGSSSIFKERIATKYSIGSYTVKGLTIKDLINSYGIPHYLKIDIEGADRFCVLPLDKESRPQYISFEIGDDVDELVKHLRKMGFTKFKAINQCNFYELSNQDTISYRVKRKIIHILGYAEPNYVRRNGRLFKLGHSSGPPPWESDGHWCDAKELLTRWNRAKSENRLNGWYDLHAM
jgi:FkbM family methyltransferase